MSEYQLIELVFLAALAGYLIYRLYLVLGQSDGETPKKPSAGKVVHLKPISKIRETIKVKTAPPSSSNPTLDELKKYDPNFNENDFRQGAEEAFSMIVEAFSKGELSSIKPYISKKVYDSFAIALEKRKEKGETHDTQVVAIPSLEIIAVSIGKGIAKLTVQIESDQATTVKNKKGQDLYPENDEIERVIDQWVFTRKIDSDDPNWILQEIQEVSDEKANGWPLS